VEAVFCKRTGKASHRRRIHTIRVYSVSSMPVNGNKRINVILPETTIAVMDRVARRGNRSRLIDQAVLHYIQSRGKQSLREQLRAGYRANADRDLATSADWFPVEEEAWETATAKPPNRPARAKRK